MRSSLGTRRRASTRFIATTVIAALAITLLPAPAAAGWWGGTIEFNLGWPPVRFGKTTAGEDPAKVGRLVEASLTREAWQRTAPQVRGIATGDSRAEIEATLVTESHEVARPGGGTRKVVIGEGYLAAISTPRRMEFGYVEDHLVVRQWTVFFDEAGRVAETAVFPVGRNEALLGEPRPADDPGEGPPVSAYALDYRLGKARGYPFLSRTGWAHAEAGLGKIRPGDTRLDVERAVDGRYYVYGVDAWFMANGYLPQASSYDENANRETLAFGWEEAGVPAVKARVVLENDRVVEVRFEGN